jgi:hypothetical protein
MGGAWDRIRAALRREKQDIDEAVDEFTAKANAALDERERELHATPEEKIAIEQERARENDAELEAIRRRIEERGGGAP